MFNYLRKKLPQNIFLRRWYSTIKAAMAAITYGFPAKKLYLIGVTGTDGKTTCVELIKHYLVKLDKKTAKISSTHFTIAGKTWENKTKRTTVSPFVTQKFLKECVKQKVEYVVLEVSSHALAQNRVWGIKFDLALLTNITHEHLDFHGTIEQLRLDKKRLFTKYLKSDGLAIINRDDPVFADWSKDLLKIKSYSLMQKEADYFGTNFKDQAQGLEFELQKPEKLKARCGLKGDFNAENTLGAVAIVSQAIKIKENQEVLPQLAKLGGDFTGAPGRLEMLNFGQDFQIYLDFAITPNSFEKTLAFLQRSTKGNLIVVFGATGSHDREKRPLLGKIAKENADTIILTDDETYQEDAQQVREEVKEGIFTKPEEEQREISLENRRFYEIPDRRQAIENALQLAKPNDAVIVSGMGILDSRNMAGKEEKWSDKEVIKEVFATMEKIKTSNV
jgi:UDP-N-acetylmuramyl-tripeptide synthetase